MLPPGLRDCKQGFKGLFGQTLQNGFPLERLPIFPHIVMALEYCHSFKLAHRDLKTRNVLLFEDHLM